METFNITADKRRSSFSLFHSHQCFFLLPVFHVSFLLDPSVIVYYSVLAIGLSGFCWYAVLITNWDSLEVQVCHFAEKVSKSNGTLEADSKETSLHFGKCSCECHLWCNLSTSGGTGALGASTMSAGLDWLLWDTKE